MADALGLLALLAGWLLVLELPPMVEILQMRYEYNRQRSKG